MGVGGARWRKMSAEAESGGAYAICMIPILDSPTLVLVLACGETTTQRLFNAALPSSALSMDSNILLRQRYHPYHPAPKVLAIMVFHDIPPIFSDQPAGNYLRANLQGARILPSEP